MHFRLNRDTNVLDCIYEKGKVLLLNLIVPTVEYRRALNAHLAEMECFARYTKEHFPLRTAKKMK